MLAGEDAIVAANDVIADFVSYIWFVLAAEEDLGRVGEAADPASAFASTFAYTQLTTETRERLEHLISVVGEAYAGSPTERRRGWARVGTSIASARALDRLADEIVGAVLAVSDGEVPGLADPLGTLSRLQELGVLNRLLQLPEVPRAFEFRRTESGQSPKGPSGSGRICSTMAHRPSAPRDR